MEALVHIFKQSKDKQRSIENDPLRFMVCFQFSTACLLARLRLLTSDDCTCPSTLIIEPSKHCWSRPIPSVNRGWGSSGALRLGCPPGPVKAGGTAGRRGHTPYSGWPASCLLYFFLSCSLYIQPFLFVPVSIACCSGPCTCWLDSMKNRRNSEQVRLWSEQIG